MPRFSDALASQTCVLAIPVGLHQKETSLLLTKTLLTKSVLVTTATAVVAAGAVAAAGTASAATTIAGTYNTVTPTRVLDTINGVGTLKAPIGAGRTLTFSTATALGTTNVSAEALTVTAVAPKAGGYLLVYPGGATRPNTSTINLQAGRTTTNSAIVPYGAAGTVSIYNAGSQPVNVLTDLNGYYAGGAVAADTDGAYHPVPASRIFETASTNALVRGQTSVTVPVVGHGGVPTNATEAVVNLTVARPSDGGYLTATASPTDQNADSRTADLSFIKNLSEAALTVVPLNTDGSISIYNGSPRSTNVIVDLLGYFTGTGDDSTPYLDGAFTGGTPYRNTDTRSGPPLASGATIKVPVVGATTEGPSLFKAVVIALTETRASQSGYLTAWSGSGARPKTQALFFSPKTDTTTAIVPLNADGTISIYNGSMASTAVIFDVHGFVLNDLSGDNSPQAQRAKIRTALSQARRAAAVRVVH